MVGKFTLFSFRSPRTHEIFPKSLRPCLFATIFLARRQVPLVIIAGCHQAAPLCRASTAEPCRCRSACSGQFSPCPPTDTYVSTIKEPPVPATMQPQVDGNITRIFVKSGDLVKAGQVLMQIDPLKQVATVQSQQGTEQQQKAVYQFNQSDLARQKQLYDSGIISKQAYEQSLQAFQNSKGALDSASALTNTQKQQLAYYQIRAPFAGIVGDIPVHLGDYVSHNRADDRGREATTSKPTSISPPSAPRQSATAWPSTCSTIHRARSSRTRPSTSFHPRSITACNRYWRRRQSRPARNCATDSW